MAQPVSNHRRNAAAPRPAASSARRTPASGTSRRGQGNPPSQGSGLLRLGLTALAIAGLGLAISQWARGPIAHLLNASSLPPCGKVINRWANGRLQAARARFEAEHDLYRADGPGANAVTGAMTWIDDRIIDHKLEAEWEQIHASVLNSSQCAPLRDR